jgi:hypothetical protein
MGYAYTYSFTGATIKPGQSTTQSCFGANSVCANGSVPADNDAGAGIGWNINQASGGGTADSLKLTGSVTFKLSGVKAGMRVGLGPADSTEMEYCYTLTAADATAANGATGLTLTVDSFAQSCWATDTAVPYAGGAIKSVQVSVPGSMSGAQTFDFCLVDIHP